MTSSPESKVLDKGFVSLVNSMGDDLTVVNAARVSFSKRSDQMGEKDSKLIGYLAKHEHWTPFGHCYATFHLKMPIFVARQWMRSNIGIVYNEVSRRYVDSDPEFYVPEVWRKRPEGSVKQGSGEEVDPKTAGEAKQYYHTHMWRSIVFYRGLVERVAPEMARMILPQSTYTELWMSASLAALARVYKLRIDSHAQWEVQQYAKALGEHCERLWPVSWKALTNKDTNEPRTATQTA